MFSRSGENEYPPAFGSTGPKRVHRLSEQFRGREEDMEHAGNDWPNTQDGRLGDFDLFGPSPSENEAATGSGRRPRASNARDSYGGRTAETEEAGVVEKHLPVTLEEIFYGTVKKLKVRRTVEDLISRRYRDEERILEVPIYRGLKPGSKIKFAGEGGISNNGVKRDLHFILVEKQHSVFTLRDRDLHCVLEIPLVDSLLGWQRWLTSICGKQIKVSHQGPTPSSWQECFAGLGMCSHKNTNERGDLLVGVKIKYPASLNEKQKSLIRDALQGK
jgi:DnaJ family protein B protein 4